MKTAVVAFSAALAVVSAEAQSAEAIFGDFGKPAWSRVYKYIESRFGEVAKDEKVLVLPIATTAAWDDPVKILRLTEQYKWGDWTPSFAWQYSPNYARRISTGYQTFLNHAWVATVDASGTINDATKNALRRSNEELNFTRAEYIAAINEADLAYDAHVRDTPRPQRLSKRDFLHKFHYQENIDAKRRTLDDAANRLKEISKNLVDPDIKMLRDAQEKLDNPRQKISLPPTPDLLGDRERWQTYYISLIDKKIEEFLGARKPQEQIIDESKEKSEYFEQRWSASVSVSFLGLFRAGGGSAEQVKREQHIKNNTTRIAISFDNIDTFNIVRGEWFDENVISRFAPKLKADSWTAIWGTNGQLELIPKTLLVGRGMSFAIYADSNSLDYLYEHFHAGADAGISIGWWRIGGGGDYSSTKEKTEVYKLNDRIIFRDLTGRGSVLAMLAKHYASSVPKPAFVTALMALQFNEEQKSLLKKQDAAQPSSNILKTVLDPTTLQDVTTTQ